MTTKYKIILGFVCMVLILGATSYLGYKYLGESSAGLDSYRKAARLNVEMSDAMVALNDARAYMNRYLGSFDKQHIETSHKSMESFFSQIDMAEKEISNQESVDAIARIRSLGTAYSEGLAQLETSITALDAAYKTKVLPASNKLSEATIPLRNSSRSIGNANVLAELEQMWQEYSYMRGRIGLYLYSRKDVDLQELKKRFLAARTFMESVGQHLLLEESQGHHRDIAAVFTTLSECIAEMEQAGKDASETIDTLYTIRDNLSKELLDFSSRADTAMRTFGDSTAAEAVRGQTIMLGASAGGVLASILLAAFAIFGLLRALREAKNFAHAVADGDFKYVPKVREGGEIGEMLDSMRRIPAVLNSIVEKAQDLTNEIMYGHLRQRVNTSEYKGSFADLTRSVNSVSDAYTHILDNLDVPTMACDGKCKINYLSVAAQEVIGGNHVGKYCYDELNSPCCNTEKCLGRLAVARKEVVRGETQIHPVALEKKMEVAVSCVPLCDSNGEAVGFMEILNDITVIKEQQTTMLRVAQEAEEISNNIASSSEELSNQVKEISDGTDIQRTRVDSTATAMNEMNTTVLEVARNASDASDQIEETRIKAEGGSELVNQLVGAINAVNGIGQQLQLNMQELGEQAENIGSVMNVISDIADQTNLLALNAAIEAARAGEAGRGFAVVADEVRKLAEKTMHATKEVGSSIGAVQQSARVNIDEVGKAVTRVSEANSLADSSGEALHEIVNMAASNSALVASIATAAEEQSATSEEINRDIEEINNIVAHTAENMVQSSMAVQVLSRMAQELHQVMVGLK